MLFQKNKLIAIGTLITKIKEQMRTKKEEGAKVGFRIFMTDYEQNFSFCEGMTHFIQE